MIILTYTYTCDICGAQVIDESVCPDPNLAPKPERPAGWRGFAGKLICEDHNVRLHLQDLVEARQ